MYNKKPIRHNQFKSQRTDIDSVPKKPKEPEISDLIAFPELVSTGKPTEDNCSMNFKNKVVVLDEVAPSEKVVDDSWYKDKGLTLLVRSDKPKTKPKYSVVEKELTFDERLKQLFDMLEARKKEYIDEYGYDDYERHFRFQDYDYEYFDKLDAIYDLEMEQQEYREMELENEREQNEDFEEFYTRKDYI
jgi:hypothetical protein